MTSQFANGRMRLLLNASGRQQMARYILASLGGYVFSVAGINLTTQQFGLKAVVAYAIVYALLYAVDYVITCRWIFAVSSSSSRIKKYLVYLFSSWIVGTITFALISGVVSRVSIAVIVNLCFLFPLRFAVSKLWLYQPLSDNNLTNRTA